MPGPRERVEQHLRQPGRAWLYGWLAGCLLLSSVLPDPADEAVPGVAVLGLSALAIRSRAPSHRPPWRDVTALSMRRAILTGVVPVVFAFLAAAEDVGRPLGADRTGFAYAVLAGWLVTSLAATAVYVQLASRSRRWQLATWPLLLLAAGFLSAVWHDDAVGDVARWTLVLAGGVEAAMLLGGPIAARRRRWPAGGAPEIDGRAAAAPGPVGPGAERPAEGTDPHR